MYILNYKCPEPWHIKLLVVFGGRVSGCVDGAVAVG